MPGETIVTIGIILVRYFVANMPRQDRQTVTIRS